ncbi:MAG TPA: hypothetical protein VFQ31_06060 [Methyloceanibacter sp.]|nr:hypothetical protein [Methyloceanibacter sp.]
MGAIERYMSTTRSPMLLVYAELGVLVPPSAVGWYTSRIRNLETTFVEQGVHFIQEDQPVAIGRAVSDWLRRR